MVITVIDHVPLCCFTSEDGAVIHDVLAKAFASGQHVTLSFSGVSDTPSSFVNAALVPFVETRGADWLRAHLTIVNATKQVAEMIRRCLGNAAQTAARA